MAEKITAYKGERGEMGEEEDLLFLLRHPEPQPPLPPPPATLPFFLADLPPVPPSPLYRAASSMAWLCQFRTHSALPLVFLSECIGDGTSSFSSGWASRFDKFTYRTISPLHQYNTPNTIQLYFTPLATHNGSWFPLSQRPATS